MSGSPSESLSDGGGTTVVEADPVDWISSLPDSILCFILSLLPTKQAVATSVLSKRWQPLCRSLQTLEFDDGYYYHKTKEDYHRLVHSVSALILHLQHPIHTFSIRCWPRRFFSALSPKPGCISPFTDPANVTTWVNAVLQRGGVQHLRLHLSHDLLFSKPPINNLSSIFNCKTLVVLKLENIWLEPVSAVDLPLLKVMHIQSLRLSELECLAELLSGCPLLEDFKETGLYFERDYLQHEVVPGTRSKTLPTLLRADLSSSLITITLEVVASVKFLYIELEARFVGATGPFVFPMFPNLTHIQLDYCYSIRDWSQVVELIKNCPRLQVIVISQPQTANWQYPPSILHLTRCTNDDQTQFARYIREDSKDDDNMQWYFYKYSNSTISQLDLVDDSFFFPSLYPFD